MDGPLVTELLYLQVETVGDKYMAVSGLPERCKEHAQCIARLSLDMMDISKDLYDPDGNKIVVSIMFFLSINMISIFRS